MSKEKKGIFAKSWLGELSKTEMLERMIHLINPKSTDRVLDLGTGAGNTAIALAPYVSDVIALDMDEKALTECKNKYR